MSELVVAARVAPPGVPLIAGAILNAVHYQRPDTVLLAVLFLVGFGSASPPSSRRFAGLSGPDRGPMPRRDTL